MNPFENIVDPERAEFDAWMQEWMTKAAIELQSQIMYDLIYERQGTFAGEEPCD